MMTNSKDWVEAVAQWLGAMQGRVVTRCVVDYGFTVDCLQLDELFSIRVEGEFVFRSAGREYHLSTNDPVALGPCLAILHKTVGAAGVHEDGSLDVRLTDDNRLLVPAQSRYEAWVLNGPQGLRVVCMPGGELAVWKPEPS